MYAVTIPNSRRQPVTIARGLSRRDAEEIARRYSNKGLDPVTVTKEARRPWWLRRKA